MTAVCDPAVSVICPVWNGAAVIGPTLAALSRQTEPSFEAIFVDDASTDASAQLIRSFGNDAFRLVSVAKNEGPVAARNRAISAARGRYIAVNDQDDVSHPDRLRLQRHVLDHHPRVSAVCSLIQTIDGSGRAIRGVADWTYSQAEARVALAFHNCVTHSTLMFRKPASAEPVYAPDWPVCEDYRLLSQLAFDGEGIILLRRKLVSWRSHDSNHTKQVRQDMATASRRLRGHLLSRWGLNPSPYEWSLHDAFETPPDEVNRGFLHDCSDWLIAFRLANLRCPIVPDPVARKVLLSLWFELAHKYAALGPVVMAESGRLVRALGAGYHGVGKLLHLGSKAIVKTALRPKLPN